MDRRAFASMSPQDAAAALRSFPRRFAAAFRSRELAETYGDAGEGELTAAEAAALVDSSGPSGVTPRQLIAGAAAAMARFADALTQVRLHDSPELAAETLAPGGPRPAAGGGPLTAELDLLREAATALAGVVEAAPNSDWRRTARLPDGRSITALELLQEAIAQVRGGLDELEATLAALRRR
ncbi:MAG: hypothetical protein ACKVWR_09035 [Acidimicrobiales bacterium]